MTLNMTKLIFKSNCNQKRYNINTFDFLIFQHAEILKMGISRYTSKFFIRKMKIASV